MPVTQAHLWLVQYDHKFVLIYWDKGDVIGFFMQNVTNSKV